MGEHEVITTILLYIIIQIFAILFLNALAKNIMTEKNGHMTTKMVISGQKVVILNPLQLLHPKHL